LNSCPQDQIYPSSEVGLKKYIICFLKPPYIAQSNLFFLRKSDCQCRVYQRRIEKNKFRPSPFKVALHGITYIKTIGRGLKTTFLKICFMSCQSSPPTCPSAYLLPFLESTLFNNIMLRLRCHKLYKGLLGRFCAKGSNAIVMTLCYVMLLVSYLSLSLSLWKVIIYKLYDITSATLCYSFGGRTC
jgi:hypothetical protein